MSTTVDNRVVEMKFDNSNFEKNIKVSQESLKKFSEALNINKPAEEFNKSINTAVNKVDFSSMANSIESIANRFSTLGVIGMTVLQNLTNSAVNAAKQMVSSMTNTVIQGGKTRAQNIENAKFQLEGLGIAWKDISADINYGVESTAYGLDSAAMAAAQLSASGVKFGETFGTTGNSPMSKALRGISGLAAMTNSSYEDISRIFTTVAGNGRLMSNELNMIGSRGVNAAAEMTKFFNDVNSGARKASKSVTESIKSLTNGNKITETELRDFVSKSKVDFAMFSEAMDSAFGEHAKDANKTLNGVLSNIRSALAKIGADFWTPIIENEGKLVEMLNSFKTLVNDIKTSIRDTLGWFENDEGIGYLMDWKNLMDGIFTRMKEGLDSIDRVKLGKNVENIIRTIQSFGKSIINIFGEVSKIVGALGTAFKTVFNIKDSTNITGFIRNLSERFEKFTDNLKLTPEIIENITSVFKAAFSILSLGFQVASGIFGVIKEIVAALVPAGKSALGFAGGLSEIILKITDFIKKNEIIVTAFKTISTVLSSVVKAVSTFVSAFLSGFSEVTLGTKSMGESFSKLGDKFKSFLENIKEFVNKHMPKVSQSGLTLGKIFGSVGKVIGSVFDKVSSFAKVIAPGIKSAVSGIVTVLDGLIDNVIKLFNNLDFSKGFSLLSGGIFTSMLLSFDKFIKGLETKGTIFSKVLNQLTWNLQQAIGADGTRAALIKNFGIAIGILAGALFVLASIDPDKLTGPLAAITALLWQLAAVLKFLSSSTLSIDKPITNLFSSISQGIRLREQTSALVKFAASIFIMAGALRMLAELDPEQLAVGIAGLTAILAELYFLSKALGKNKVDLVEGSAGIIALAIGVGILTASVKSLSELSWESLAKGLVGLAGILGGVAGLAVTLKTTKATYAIARIGLAMIPFAAGVVILSAALKNLSNLSWQELAVGLTGLAGILAGVAGLAITLKTTKATLTIMALGLAMIPLATGILILSTSLKNLSGLSWNSIAVGLTGLAGALAGVAGLAITIKTTGTTLTIMALGLAMIPLATGISILAGALKTMGGLSWDGVLKGLASLAGVLGSIAGLAIALRYTESSIIKTAAGLLVMGVALNLLLPVIVTLANLSLGSIGKGILALAGVFTVFGLAAYVLEGVIVPMLALAGAVALFGIGCLAAGAGVLMFGTGLTALGAGIAALGMSAVAVIRAIINLLPEIVRAVGGVIEEFAAVIAKSLPSVIFAVVTLIEAACKAVLEAAPMIFKTIISLLDSLIEYLPQIVDRVITLIIGILDGVANRMGELVQSIAKLFKSFIDAVLDLFKDVSLGDFLSAIKDLSLAAVLLAVAGEFGVAALKGIVVLAAMVAGVGLIVTGLGWLVDKIPELEELLEKGIPILEKIGYGIGAFIGNVIGGLAAGISNGLPAIAENLSLFMTNLQPFVNMARQIDDSVANGALAIAETVLILTSAKLLDGLANLFGSDTTFATLGEQLVPFGEAMMQFAGSVQGLDSATVENAANAGKMVAEMAAALPNTGGVAGFFAGENDMSIVGPQLEDFGKAMKAFGDSVVGLDADVVQNAANAGKAIAEMAKELPNQGGVAGFFAGENNMSIIAPQLIAFGRAMKSFAGSVSGIDPEAVQNSAIAGKALAEMAKELPNSGGVAGFFAGENDLATFAPQLVLFGAAMKLYSIAISGIDTAAVTASAAAGAALAAMADTIPNSGGVVAFFAGDNNIDEFGKKLVPFGESMKLYSDAVTGIDAMSVLASALAGAALAALASNIENSGGVVSFFTGDKDMARFGAQLIVFGHYMSAYSHVVSDMDIKSAYYSALVGQALTNLASGIGNSGGLVTLFTGDNNLQMFGQQLVAFGFSLVRYSQTVSSVDYESINQTFGLLEKLLKTFENLSQVDTNFGNNFASSLTKLSSLGLSAFTRAFSNPDGKVMGAVKSFISKVLGSFKDFDTKVSTYSKKAIDAFVNAITNKKNSAYSAGVAVGNKVLEALKSFATPFYNAGTDNVRGYIRGMTDRTSDVYTAGYNMGKTALIAAKKAVDSNSPSKEFENLGMDDGRGLVNGLLKMTKAVDIAGSDLSSVALNSVAAKISKINDFVSDNLDATPTITPVVDFSEIQNGIHNINNTQFGRPFALGTMSISLASQLSAGATNETNKIYDDSKIIKAINGLDSRLESLADRIEGMSLVLDSGALVGEIAPGINNALGGMQRKIERGIMT